MVIIGVVFQDSTALHVPNTEYRLKNESTNLLNGNYLTKDVNNQLMYHGLRV